MITNSYNQHVCAMIDGILFEWHESKSIEKRVVKVSSLNLSENKNSVVLEFYTT